MATHAEGVKGFLALLCDMLWHANVTFVLEYAVYARGVGPNVVEYLATVDIQKRWQFK